MSSPWVRIADVPQTVRPTDFGYAPVSVRYRWISESASDCPTSQLSREGIALGSTE